MSSAHPDSKPSKGGNGKKSKPTAGYIKARKELAEEINKQMPAKERVEKVVALAKGVMTATTSGQAYEEKPDLKAIEWLENYATGRPVNVLETEDGSKGALACILVPSQRALAK